jgi:fermentation-respiration switch protein FrsA (DUF1100 family)
MTFPGEIRVTVLRETDVRSSRQHRRPCRVSLGGTIAIAAAAQDERVAAVCVAAAFSSWATIASNHAPVIGRLLIRPGVDAVESVTRLGTRPILIVHGSADDVVPLAHGHRIHAAATAAGVKSRIIELPGGRHNDWPMTHPVATHQIAAFFRDQFERSP